MSSHHIVREKQEPALLILNTTGFNNEHLGQLLEWSPTVLVGETAYDEIFSLGIKIDYLITDDHSPDVQEHTLLIPAKDKALASAMSFLIERSFPSVNIVTDNFKSDMHSPLTNKIDQVIFSGGLRIFSIRPGFKKWKEKNERIYLFTVPENLSITGLEEISKNTFRTVSDGFYSLTFSDNSIFIAEEY